MKEDVFEDKGMEIRGSSGTEAETDANAEFIAHACIKLSWLGWIIRKLLEEVLEV